MQYLGIVWGKGSGSRSVRERVREERKGRQ
jgi:hypothetical protein